MTDLAQVLFITLVGFAIIIMGVTLGRKKKPKYKPPFYTTNKELEELVKCNRYHQKLDENDDEFDIE